MLKIMVKPEGHGTHAVFWGDKPVAFGLSLDEAENCSTFLRASLRVHRTHKLPGALNRRV
ncbi:hypothetical protein [Methylobacterium oxalidis]|uniref:Uncharacterized protein n=1 Tax=Methylobacterium oxalidis TaxID=944322 RepID=A0A512JBP3_9HYPH|nr:hypothetical protein [Methylobacterium oxalidis]GEP07319.1 hypothetical protein MOX02_53570 [Methylobacterium oxalidis]GJE31581.1 hypothetical protein LDDCCGHA_1761 [Methylobacterium oxalidis]GLS64097.1 hypothetical protein GCM10007888_24780 [Methylobacterium oxalidis]